MSLLARFNAGSARVVRALIVVMVLLAIMAAWTVLLIGLAGTWRALGQRPAQHLRNE